MNLKVLAGVFSIILLFGCITPQTSEESSGTELGAETAKPTETPKTGTGETEAKGKNPVEKCIALCEKALSEGTDLGKGPCLSSNNPEWNFDQWVCDVAHKPRKAVDNDPKNQCPEFNVSASNFVEVSPECKLIREYKG